MNYFSLARFLALAQKEFIQMRRDRLTFAMMVGIPLIQLVLFGYAINSDPKHLPTALYAREISTFARSIAAALKASDYFRVVAQPATEKEAQELIARGDVLFVIQIPTDFSRRIVRGESPAVLVQTDATDPLATQNALGAVSELASSALDRDLRGITADLRSTSPPFRFTLQRSYNPEGLSQWNIVPGLMGVVLTMTMIIITAVAITRERERGTMENLLSTPALPLEVMIGKIVPYVLVGYVQVVVILLAARFLFYVPMIGSIVLLSACAFLFILANLAVGILFSIVAKTQLQAVQMSFFFFLPSILLSGFMFPFKGLPEWAQYLGSILPLTHFLRVVRGILLKGNTAAQIMPHMLPIGLFALFVLLAAMLRYKQTVD